MSLLYHLLSLLAVHFSFRFPKEEPQSLPSVPPADICRHSSPSGTADIIHHSQSEDSIVREMSDKRHPAYEAYPYCPAYPVHEDKDGNGHCSRSYHPRFLPASGSPEADAPQDSFQPVQVRLPPA